MCIEAQYVCLEIRGGALGGTVALSILTYENIINNDVNIAIANKLKHGKHE